MTFAATPLHYSTDEDPFHLVEAELASTPLGQWYLSEVRRRTVVDMEECLTLLRDGLEHALSGLRSAVPADNSRCTSTVASRPTCEGASASPSHVQPTPSPATQQYWSQAPQPARTERARDTSAPPVATSAPRPPQQPDAPQLSAEAAAPLTIGTPRLDRIAGQIASAMQQREQQQWAAAATRQRPSTIPRQTGAQVVLRASEPAAKAERQVTTLFPKGSTAAHTNPNSIRPQRWSVQDLLTRASQEFGHRKVSKIDFSSSMPPDLSQFIWSKLRAQRLSGDEHLALPQAGRDILAGARHAYHFGDSTFREDAEAFVANFETHRLSDSAAAGADEELALIRSEEGRTYVALLFVLGRHGLKLD